MAFAPAVLIVVAPVSDPPHFTVFVPDSVRPFTKSYMSSADVHINVFADAGLLRRISPAVGAADGNVSVYAVAGFAWSVNALPEGYDVLRTTLVPVNGRYVCAEAIEPMQAMTASTRSERFM